MTFSIPKTILMSNGRQVDVNNITPDDLDIMAIAHALSLVCRWGGHCSMHYSVAQHSIYCAEVALLLNQHRPKEWREDFAKKVLLHDANEAFLGDIPRPFKRFGFMEAYCAIERTLQRSIWRHFGYDPEDDASLDAIDLGVAKIERDQMMPKGSYLQDVVMPSWSFSIKRVPRQATIREMYVNFLVEPEVRLITDWKVRDA